MLENLRAIRRERGMTQQDVADRLGISRQSLSNYENGNRQPEYALLCAMAELLRCPVSRLMGFSGAYESAGARIPILGTVKGGFNRRAEQEFEGYEVADVAAPDEYFFLRVTGDSMAPQIQEGEGPLRHRDLILPLCPVHGNGPDDQGGQQRQIKKQPRQQEA